MNIGKYETLLKCGLFNINLNAVSKSANLRWGIRSTLSPKDTEGWSYGSGNRQPLLTFTKGWRRREGCEWWWDPLLMESLDPGSSKGPRSFNIQCEQTEVQKSQIMCMKLLGKWGAEQYSLALTVQQMRKKSAQLNLNFRQTKITFSINMSSEQLLSSTVYVTYLYEKFLLIWNSHLIGHPVFCLSTLDSFESSTF